MEDVERDQADQDAERDDDEPEEEGVTPASGSSKQS